MPGSLSPTGVRCMTQSVQGMGENWHTYVEAASPPPNAQGLAYKQDLTPLRIPSTGQPLFQAWGFNLTIGQTQTFFCDGGVPEYWIVGITPSAAVRLSVWNGPNASGVPFVIGGGGKVRLPSNAEYVTVQATLGTCIGNVVALRNLEFEYDPGNVT